MNYRSIAQLSDQLIGWSKTLPHDIDVVVGIPRSGLLAANIFALYRNLPLADLDGFLAGRVLGTGKSRSNPFHKKEAGVRADDAALTESTEQFLDRPRRVLVLDDSIHSGRSLQEAREKIEAAGLPHDVVYGAVYVTPETVDLPDVYCEVLYYPRAFEWNVLHHHVLRSACLDMDGVLCVDPLSHENDDGEKYRRFLLEARPLLLPTAFIGHIVTSRLEKFRPETEAWLAEHGVTYGSLVMMDYPDRETRMRMNTYSAHKAKAYRETGATLFIESEIKQAVEIASLSKKEVLCIDTMQLIQPGSLPIARPGLPLVDEVAPDLSRRIVRRLFPKSVRNGLHALRKRTR